MPKVEVLVEVCKELEVSLAVLAEKTALDVRDIVELAVAGPVTVADWDAEGIAGCSNTTR